MSVMERDPITVEPSRQYRPMIRDLPQGQRPRERLKAYGPKSLSNTELIAILLRTGMQGETVISLSSRLLAQFNGLDGLGRVTFAELCAQRGLSEAKASQLLAALELGCRLLSLTPEERTAIGSPQDVANLLMAEMAILDKEHPQVLLLNTRNEVVGTQEIYVGNVNSSMVRPAEVLRPAVRENVPSIIVVRNHPSGAPRPSAKDMSVTRVLVSAVQLLGVGVLDHVVIESGNRFISLNERGLGFP